MTQLSLILPEIGSPSKTEDPKTDNAFIAVQTWANGNIDATNLKAEGVTAESLATVKSSIVTTEQTREGASYGKLTTPDEVLVTMRSNGLIAIGFQARWAESVQGAARASIFIGSNQLKVDLLNVPTAQETMHAEGTGSINTFRTLASCAEGLRSISNIGPGAEDVTTGQVLGQAAFAGPCFVFAAAGTYGVSVQFKASSGKVTAKQRKLWVWSIGP